MFNITRTIGDICELINILLKKDEKKGSPLLAAESLQCPRRGFARLKG
jgi:hypothetical protein